MYASYKLTYPCHMLYSLIFFILHYAELAVIQNNITKLLAL